MIPFSIELDLHTGAMRDPRRVTVRKASDMRGYYSDSQALQRLIEEKGDPLHYEVFEVPVAEEYGHLMYCISKLQPGQVGQEHFMTKGHFHARAGTAEVYLGIRGRGYILMCQEGGEFAAEKISRGTMVYVPPHWAHRSVNTGSEPLVSFCVYPAEAGHEYGDIATKGFPKRLFLRGGKEVFE
jgi:glucose-6-phosphate isomerase